MKPNWDFRALSDVCQIKPPKKEAKQRLSDDELVSFVPMDQLGIRAKDLQLSTDRQLKEVAGSYTYFAEGDVLLAKITPCFENGKLGIPRGLTNGIGFGSSEFIVFRPVNGLDPEYLFYFLSQDTFRDAGANVMSGAVGHKRVPKDFIESYPIPVPPVDEQKRTVAILDDAFAGIETAIANTEKNLANARKLFESYLNAIFNQKTRGWTTNKLTDIGLIQTGNTPKTSEKDNYGDFISFIKPGDFHDDGSLEYLNNGLSKKGSTKARIVPSDSVLMVCIGATIGKTAFVSNQVTTNQQINSITPKTGFSSKFIYYQMLTKVFQESVISQAGQTTLPIINKKKWSELELIFPGTIEEQNEIVAALDDLGHETRRIRSIYQRKLAALAELKQSLLQKAFSGELAAKKAEDEVKEAVA